ncbi:SUKH-3 domain-containing protein [Streptomyces sp. NPDC046939]|uniref:SUKH-3 domain-containing protein n=1 Tax=Streptomyces sp. NPDC046939 TaxID=3155376 RepID=UPI0033D664F2
MRVLRSAAQVDAWLGSAGWYPGRRCDELAATKIESVLAAFHDDGGGLEIIDPALEFIREHVGLELPVNEKPKDMLFFEPLLTYTGAAEDVQELADGLGQKVFPVAHDLYDAATVLIDEAGRFFYVHSSGEYYLGEEKYSALMSYSRGYPLESAENYYA